MPRSLFQQRASPGVLAPWRDTVRISIQPSLFSLLLCDDLGYIRCHVSKFSCFWVSLLLIFYKNKPSLPPCTVELMHCISGHVCRTNRLCRNVQVFARFNFMTTQQIFFSACLTVSTYSTLYSASTLPANKPTTCRQLSSSNCCH